MTPEIEDFLEETIVGFMRQAKMFTSLDIANIAKDEGHRVRNYQVSDWLRRNAIPIAQSSSYLYDQSLIKVDSSAVGMTLAYLYHHYMDDKDDYLDRDQNPKSFTVPTTQLPSVVADPATRNIQPLASLLHTSNTALPPTYFRSRELARDFARDHNDYKFVDNGRYWANKNERWTCVAR